MKVIVFGASGDLAKRKLFPALAKLNLDTTEIIAFARTKFEKPFSEILSDFYAYENKSFCDKVQYVRCDKYTNLKLIEKHLNSDTLVYLSLPPEVYVGVLHELEKYEYGSVAIEKPFGENSESFAEFKKFPSDKLYFIDHFLLKHLVVAWPKIIDSCCKLKDLLSTEYINTVRVIFKEDIGGEGRTYFDASGIVKDVVQSHLSELVALAASKGHISSCKERSIERTKIFAKTKLQKNLCLFGQYNEYQHEMKKRSDTETFAIVSFSIDTKEWKDVSFIAICGKGLNEKRTEIVYEFKKKAFKSVLPFTKQTFDFDEISAVKLVLNLYPRNEIYLEVEIKNKLQVYTLFDKNEVERHMHEIHGKYENHEIIFNSFINNTSFDCVRYAEAEILWELFAEIIDKPKKLFYYSKGTEMPREAENLLQTFAEE